MRRSPAPYFELVLLFESSGGASKPVTAQIAAKAQTLAPGAISYGIYPLASGVCYGCAGLYPQGENRYEAWFACWPSLARGTLSFLRLAQLTLSELPDNAIVEARVAPGSPGERIARLLGFADTAEPGLMERRI